MSYLQFIILFVPDNRVLSAICIFLQCKDHIGIPLKKAETFLPAYPTFAVLQTDKLLFHFSSAVWAYLITFSHRHTTPFCKTLFNKIPERKNITLNKYSCQIHRLPASTLSYLSAAYRSCPHILPQAPFPCPETQYNLPL